MFHVHNSVVVGCLIGMSATNVVAQPGPVEEAVIASEGGAAQLEIDTQIRFRTAEPSFPLARAAGGALAAWIARPFLGYPPVGRDGLADDSGWRPFGGVGGAGINVAASQFPSFLMYPCEGASNPVPSPAMLHDGAYSRAMISTFPVDSLGKEWGINMEFDALSLAGIVTIERSYYPGFGLVNVRIDTYPTIGLEIAGVVGRCAVQLESLDVTEMSVEFADQTVGYLIACPNPGAIPLSVSRTRVVRRAAVSSASGTQVFLRSQQFAAPGSPVVTANTFPFTGNSGTLPLPPSATGIVFETRIASETGSEATVSGTAIDANNDGLVNHADRIAILHAVGATVSDLQYSLGLDINLDYSIDLDDYLQLAATFPDIGVCPADVNGDQLIDGADFIAFVNAFAVGDLYADICGVGGLPAAPDAILSGDDFASFIAAFSAGCP